MQSQEETINKSMHCNMVTSTIASGIFTEKDEEDIDKWLENAEVIASPSRVNERELLRIIVLCNRGEASYG
jgi:hypothetical protein